MTGCTYQRPDGPCGQPPESDRHWPCPYQDGPVYKDDGPSCHPFQPGDAEAAAFVGSPQWTAELHRISGHRL